MADRQAGSHGFGRNFAKLGRIFLPNRVAREQVSKQIEEHERKREIASRLNVTRQVKQGYERPKSTVKFTEKPHKAKARAKRRAANKVAHESRRRNWQS